MASYMEPTRLDSFLVHILSPVYRITEDDTIRDAHMGECPMVIMVFMSPWLKIPLLSR
jgi:hypothetical protein